jgi:uncharacterized protein with FMN-binding domain
MEGASVLKGVAMKKGLKITLIVLAVVVLIVAVLIIVFTSMAKGLDAYLEEVDIREVDLGAIRDGTYHSRVHAGVIIVELEVEVGNHAIRDIRLLEHRNGQGGEAENIIPRIIEEQRINVDVISGATYSSLVIQDAVMKALSP